MSQKTKIEWTEQNWNPFRGCRRKSAGCGNCYAEAIASRFSGTDKHGKILPFTNVASKVNGKPRWNGKVELNEEELLAPLKRKQPTKYFVNSMSDTFYEEIPDDWIDKVFAVMALCPQHTFQVLTKRADRMKNYFIRDEEVPLISYWTEAVEPYVLSRFKSIPLEIMKNKTYANDESAFLKNLWLGVSVENQKAADERIPLLLETPAAVRWLSCEPLLEKIDLSFIENDGYKLNCLTGRQKDMGRPCEDAPSLIDWVVVGGESGNGSRPCDIAWIRSIVEQCQSAQVPVFVKQLGAKPFSIRFDQQPNLQVEKHRIYYQLKNKKGGDISEFPTDLQIREYPK